MTDQETTLLAEKILELSKQIEYEMVAGGTVEKHLLTCKLAPIFTAILQLSCANMSPRECFLLYLKIEKLEILSPDNKWFTGLALGHDPEQRDVEMHYIDHGGPTDFALKFGWLKHAYQQTWPLPAANCI